MSNDRVDAARLEEIATRYNPSDPTTHFDYHLKRLEVLTLQPWLIGERVLELGCATGELTSLLAPHVGHYDVVEGSARNVETARAKVSGVNFVLSLWEDFEPADCYSDIVLFGALEHVAEPVPLLQRLRGWLQPSGRIHISVPNGLSFHRLVGVELGLQPDPLTPTQADTDQGHFRNYTIETLSADLRAGGFRIAHWEGILLKVLSNRQMLDWDWELIQALHRVARRVPEHAAELYAVAVPIA